MLWNLIIGAGIMDVTTGQLALIINLGVFVLILLAFLGGYVRGLFKSTFSIIATCGSVLLFFLLFPLISKGIMRTDLSFLNVPISDGIMLTTIEETISNVLVNVLEIKVPEGVLFTETFIYQAAYSVVKMVIRLALLIVLLVLNLTLFRFIYWIIYMIVKPKPRDEFNKKIKLTKQNRLYGGLVGLLNFVLVLLVICVPLAGVFSIAETANDIIQVGTENENERILVTYDGTQINLNTNNKELLNELGIDEAYIDLIEELAPLYRKTIPGFIYSIPIGGTEIDTLIFDGLFKIKYEDQKFKIRKEIVTILEVVKMVTERTNLNVDLNSLEGIALIIDELTEAEINEIFEKLSSLQIVQFAVPLVADTMTLMIKYGDEELTPYIEFVDLIEILKTQDYHQFIKNIGGVVGSIKGFLEASNVKVSELLDGSIDYNKFLTCGKDAVNNVMENIASIELIDNLLSVAIEKAINLKDVKESLNSFIVLQPKVELSENGKYIINGEESNIDILTEEVESLSFEINSEGKWVIKYNEEEYNTNVNADGSYYPIKFNNISFSGEIRNIGKIYEAFEALGIKSIESIMKLFDESVECEEAIDFNKFTFENLNNLSKAILSSTIISSSTENIFVFVNNLLPNEYHNMIVIPETLNPEDLTSALIVGRVILKENLLSGSLENIDYKEILTNNKDEFINAIKKSNIIMTNLTPVLKMVLGMTIGEDIVIIPEDVVWGDELGNLLDGIAEILNSDILGENFDIKKINVESLSNSLSKSKVLTGSLNNILKYAIGLIEIEGFEITIPDNIVWNYDEIYSLLSAFKIAGGLYFDAVDKETNEFDVNKLLQGICELTEEDIHLIISNKLISRTVSALLYNLSNNEDGALKGIIEVNIPLEDEETWFGNDSKKGELEILLSAAKHLIKDLDISDEDNLVNNILNNVAGLSDSEIEEIASSIILTDTVRMFVESINEEEVVLVIPEDVDWNNEITNVLKAFKVIINKVELDFTNFDPNVLLDSVLEFGDDEVDLLLASRILYATVEKYLIDFDKEGMIVYKNVTDLSKEFKALLKSVKLVFGDDFSFANMEFDVNEILSNIIDLNNNFGSSEDQVGVILESKILIDTIVMYIEDINEGEDILVIPDGIVWGDTNEPGELRNILLAVKILFEGQDIDFEQLDTNIIMDLEDEDIDNVLKSKVITATIKQILEDLDGDTLVVNPIEDLSKELKALLKAVKLVLGEDVDLNNLDNIDVNEILSNVVKLTNDINASGDNDQVGQILESNILTDTIVMYIEDFASGDEAIIKLPEEDFSWKDEGNKSGEIRCLLASLNVLFGEEVDLENIDANIIMDLEDDDIDTVLESKILYCTIKSIIEDLDGDTLVVNPIEDLNKELKALLKAVKLVLGEDVDLNNLGDIDVNEILSNIVSLTNDINASGDNDQVGQILESNILTDTIVMYIEDFASGDDSVIKLPEEDFSWKDRVVAGVKIPGEIRCLLASLNVLFGEEVDLENIDANIIMDLEDDDIDTVLESKILYCTIKSIIEDLDGDTLVVNPIEDLNKELKALLKAVKLVLGDDVDLNNLGDIDVNEILSNVVKLTNDINANGDDDQVGQILESNILTDTIVMYIEDFASGDDSVIKLPEEDFSWKDEGNKSGEIRCLLASLNVLFGDEVDLENIDANIIMDLSDDGVDTVLESKILYCTIKSIIEDLDGDTLVVNPIEDLNKELKALLKAVKLVLGEDVDLNNLGDIDVNEILSNVVKLTNDINASGEDDQVGQILESNILTDTIVMYIEDFASGDDSVIKLPEEDFSWKDRVVAGVKIPGEIRCLLASLNVLFGEEVDLENIDANIIMDLSDDGVDTVLESKILYCTIKSIIEDLDGDTLVVNPIEDLNKELKALIKAVKLVLGEDVDLNNLGDIDVNEILSNVVSLTNDINANGDNDQVGQILESNILTDTIISFIEDFASGDDSVIKLPEEDFSWKDRVVAGVKIPGEIRCLLASLNILFGDEVDLENIDANIIMDLSDDGVDTVLESKILYCTIKTIIEDLDGDTLVVNPIEDLNKELKALIKAVKLVLGEDVDLTNMDGINADDVLNNIVSLTNDINASGDDDQVGQILESNILTDTIISFIEDFANEDGAVIVIPEEDFSWKDRVIAGVKIPGEIRCLLASLNVLFAGDEFDLDTLDINVIMDLSDENIDIVLESVILEGTIKNILESLDGDTLVVNPIEDVNKELKALIKALKLVLGEDGAINDFETMDSNQLLSNIVNLTNDINASGDDDQVGQVLESNILCDTIEMYVMRLADDGTIIVPDEDDLQWRDTTIAGVKVPGELRNLLKALKVLFGDEAVDMNFDANIIMDLSDDDIDVVLKSDILYLTIKSIIEDLDGATLVVNPIVNLNKELKALIKSIKIILGEDADLANPEFEVDRILEIEDDDMETMLESNIVFDTFHDMIIDLTEGSLEGILVLKPGTDLDKQEMIKFVNSIKVVLGDGNLSAMESSSFNVDKFIALEDDEIDTLLDSTLISYSAALQVDTVLYGDDAALGEFIIFESYYDSDRIDEIESDLGNIIKVIRDLNRLGINYESFNYESFVGALVGPENEGKDEQFADILIKSKIITNSLNNMMSIIFNEGIYAAFPDADVEVGEVVPAGNETLEEAWKKEIIQLVDIIDKLELVENTDITDETPVGTSTVGIENARNIGKFLDACSKSQLLEPVIIGILDAYVTCYVEFIDGEAINTMVQEEGSYEQALAGAAKLIQMFM